MHAVSGIRTHDPRIRAALDRTAHGTSLINHNSCLTLIELTVGVIRSRGYEPSSSVMKPSLTAEVLVLSKFVSRLNRRERECDRLPASDITLGKERIHTLS